MAVKLVAVALAALTIASVSSERVERQSGGPDFAEYFNKFQEQMKPIAGQFPKPPGNFGNLPNFPNFGGSTGSSGGSSLYKRQIPSNNMQEWFSQFQTGNLPFKPPQFGQFGQFGQFPSFPGTSGSSGSSGASETQNP